MPKLEKVLTLKDIQEEQERSREVKNRKISETMSAIWRRRKRLDELTHNMPENYINGMPITEIHIRPMKSLEEEIKNIAGRNRNAIYG